MVQKPIILVSSARSGTNYFLDVYQNMYKEDIVLSEIFRHGGDSIYQLRKLLGLSEKEIVWLAQNDPAKLWLITCDRARVASRRVVAKIFYYHQKGGSKIWDIFSENSKVVHLIRRNSFDVFVSTKLAKISGQWKLNGKRLSGMEENPYDRCQVVVDRDELLSFIDKRTALVERTREFYRGSDYCEVYYEDISASARDCYSVISRLVGVSPTPYENLEISLVKQKQRSNSEVVANYDAVSDLDSECFF